MFYFLRIVSDESIAASREQSVQTFLEAVKVNKALQKILQNADDPSAVVNIARKHGFFGFRQADLPVDGSGCLRRAGVTNPMASTSAMAPSQEISPSALDQTLDLDYISDIGIEEFNLELLMDPAGIGQNAFLNTMEAENPSLPILCPIARSLYYLGKPGFQDYLAYGLGNILVVDPDRTTRPSRERVSHTIVKAFDKQTIALEFDSVAEFIWAGSDEEASRGGGLPIGSLADCMLTKTMTKEDLVEQLFLLSRGDRPAPMGDLVDEGAFVCKLTYKLVSINGRAVKNKPEIMSSAHDLQFPNSWHAQIDVQPESTSDQFEWINLLGEEAKSDLLMHESWLLDALASSVDKPTNVKFNHINIDDIHQSYQEGDLTIEPLEKLEVLIGFGPQWQPENEEEYCNEDDDSETDGMIFPRHNPPIVSFSLSAANSGIESFDLDKIFPALEMLIDGAVGDN